MSGLLIKAENANRSTRNVEFKTCAAI